MANESVELTANDCYEGYYQEHCAELQEEFSEDIRNSELTKQDLIVNAFRRVLDEESRLYDLIDDIRGKKSLEENWSQIEVESFSEFLRKLPDILNDMAMRAFRNNMNLYRALYVPGMATSIQHAPKPESEKAASD